jgi:phosphoribosylaminoimidazolecarboxamide formyltransferase/IMP cyclohydrolase
MNQFGIPPIDLLVVNLYPFEATVAKPDCALADAIENIDIGGPAMLRAAAKNHAAVTVVVDAGDYGRVLKEMRDNGGAVSAATRFDLAVKVFEHTAPTTARLPTISVRSAPKASATRSRAATASSSVKAQDMRYGENPHQGAAFYVEPNRRKPASPPLASCRARNCPTTTSPTPTPRWNASRASPRQPA